MYYPIKIPSWIKVFFPSYLWGKSRKEKVIYLTFDDGPTPEVTDWVLSILNQYNAKATFFCLGKNIEKQPLIFNRITKAEHQVANHSFSHIKWHSRFKKYLKEINDTEVLLSINQSNKKLTKLFRPPYGKILPWQAKRLQKRGFTIVMWEVLSGDFDSKLKKEDCLKNVLENTESGSIVVFHDSKKAYKNLQYALPRALQIWSDKGYRFKSL